VLGEFYKFPQIFDYGEPFTQDTIASILAMLKPDYIRGLTLLGGEPFEPQNQPAIVELLRQVKAAYPQKSIWAFSGYLFDRDILSGRDNAAESYFKNMFLRTVRALEFIKSLPEWDGKTLIVHGRSQGGAQAIAAAALDKDVTLCVANVPALGDHAGVFAGRKPGWPEINPGKDPQIAAASDYVDVINLAGKVRCETIWSIGMIDTICPPVSVYLIYKNIQSVKHITLYPAMGHNAPPTLLDGRERIKSEVTK
jgi:cephalosporin-C deacetylase-like acetyl esterase